MFVNPRIVSGQTHNGPTLNGYFEFYAGPQRFVPPAFITGRNRIRLDGRYGFEGGRVLASVRATQSFVDPQEELAFTAPKFRLWETYLDLFLTKVDIRIGQQLIVWGQADGVFITDVLTPLDLSEFLAQDFSDIRLPIPAVSASYYEDNFSLTGVVTLIPTESIVPTDNSPWFVLPDLPIPFDATLAAGNLPGIGVKNIEPAVRLSYFGIDRTEFNVICLYGFNRIPAMGRRLKGIEGGVVRVEVAPTYYRRSVFGLRWSTAVTDPWVVDSEFSFQSRSDVEVDPFAGGFEASGASEDLLFSTSEALGMLGIERPFGVNFARAQLVGSLLATYDEAVLRERFRASVTGYFRRSFHRETVFASLFVFYNLGRDAWLNPALQWAPGGGFNLYAGLQLFFGDPKAGPISVSPFTLYRDNDFFYVRVTQHF